MSQLPKEKMPKEEKLKYCKGCHCDFYNGNNTLGIKECWSLEDAKVVSRKRVSMSQRPPWDQEPIEVLDCYREDGFIFVRPGVTN